MSLFSVQHPQWFMDWKLCYVRNPFLYFCSPEDYAVARGDDWDDMPYQYNAGPPTNVYCYVVALYGAYTPAPYFSVDDIRVGKGWFLEYGYGEPHERLYAGITLARLLEIAAKNELDVFIPLVHEETNVEDYQAD